MVRKKRWIDRRCCDWDTFLDSLLASARRLNFPLLLINRCEARHFWRRYGCTGHEVVLMQRGRELQDAGYAGYGEPPQASDGGNDGGGPVAPPSPSLKPSNCTT
jgi:hypothetical protein